jgi:hypothetical protein
MELADAEGLMAPTVGEVGAVSVEERNLRGLEEAGVHPFVSILWERVDPETLEPEQPPCFRDLLLDQIVKPIKDGWGGLELEPHLFTPLRDEDAVRYRQEVFRDLADAATKEAVLAFAGQMRAMRRRLSIAEKSRFRYERERWLLDAAVTYRDAVTGLGAALEELPVRSRGLRALRGHVVAYMDDDGFKSLRDDTRAVATGLEQIRYVVTVAGTRVWVGNYQGEPDFGQDVLATFAKFQQGAVKDYRVKITPGQHLGHVEARILDIVARQHPSAFEALDRFATRHAEFRDELICRFDQEVHFYLSYLSYIEPLIASGLAFCLPHVSRSSKAIDASCAFDLVLAKRLLDRGDKVVCNDVSLRGKERLLVVTGPNQGGKTTFARMVGQLHHLASIGCPVPGTEAHLYLPDRIFTHFDREEDISTLRGKLEDELIRIRGILDAATSDSLVIMNESFASTTLGDATSLGIEAIRRLTSLDVLGVYVTFIDELASCSASTVSMVGLVEPDDPAVRTFRVVRRPADGLAYASAIAAKHGLDASSLRRRLEP